MIQLVFILILLISMYFLTLNINGDPIQTNPRETHNTQKSSTTTPIILTAQTPATTSIPPISESTNPNIPPFSQSTNPNIPPISQSTNPNIPSTSTTSAIMQSTTISPTTATNPSIPTTAISPKTATNPSIPSTATI